MSVVSQWYLVILKVNNVITFHLNKDDNFAKKGRLWICLEEFVLDKIFQKMRIDLSKTEASFYQFVSIHSYNSILIKHNEYLEKVKLSL
jgi:hypothetical protein